MRILHFSQTPLAGAPWHIVQCLRKYGGLDVDLCNGRYKYADGRVFPYEKLWPIDIHRYDIIHIHNQLPPQLLRELKSFKGKVFATLHSVPRLHNWKELMEFVGKENTFVIWQPYQVWEYKREKLIGLPTLIDIYNPIFKQKKFDELTINFAPSNKLPITHPASKGYFEVVNILKEVQERTGVRLLIYSDKPHLEDIALKCRSHIIIDDVLHSTWHLTTFFGLAGNCYVVSGLSPQVFGKWYKHGGKIPTITAKLKNLKEVLFDLINQIKCGIISPQGREWMEMYWNPKKLVNYYLEIYNI